MLVLLLWGLVAHTRKNLSDNAAGIQKLDRRMAKHLTRIM